MAGIGVFCLLCPLRFAIGGSSGGNRHNGHNRTRFRGVDSAAGFGDSPSIGQPFEVHPSLLLADAKCYEIGGTCYVPPIHQRQHLQGAIP